MHIFSQSQQRLCHLRLPEICGWLVAGQAAATQCRSGSLQTSQLSCCCCCVASVMSSDVSWHIRDKLRPMREPAWPFNIALRPLKPQGSLGRKAQDGHLDFHTAPELRLSTPAPNSVTELAPWPTDRPREDEVTVQEPASTIRRTIVQPGWSRLQPYGGRSYSRAGAGFNHTEDDRTAGLEPASTIRRTIVQPGWSRLQPYGGRSYSRAGAGFNHTEDDRTAGLEPDRTAGLEPASTIRRTIVQPGWSRLQPYGGRSYSRAGAGFNHTEDDRTAGLEPASTIRRTIVQPGWSRLQPYGGRSYSRAGAGSVQPYGGRSYSRAGAGSIQPYGGPSM